MFSLALYVTLANSISSGIFMELDHLEALASECKVWVRLVSVNYVAMQVIPNLK